MLRSDADTRGTVASLARAIDEQYAHGMFILVSALLHCVPNMLTSEYIAAVDSQISLGPFVSRRLSDFEQLDLLQFYNKVHPNAHVIHHCSVSLPNSPNFLSSYADFYSHIILQGRRVVAADSLTSAPNSIVQAWLDSTWYVGQVMKIIGHMQPRIHNGKESLLLEVHWFRPLSSPPDEQ